MLIDITFDFRNDVRPNADPDKESKILLSYHKYLWSKNLPNGRKFELSYNEPNKYLFHKSSLGEFSLSSDGIGVSFINRKDMRICMLSGSNYIIYLLKKFMRCIFTLNSKFQ